MQNSSLLIGWLSVIWTDTNVEAWQKPFLVTSLYARNHGVLSDIRVKACPSVRSKLLLYRSTVDPELLQKVGPLQCLTNFPLDVPAAWDLSSSKE